MATIDLGCGRYKCDWCGKEYTWHGRPIFTAWQQKYCCAKHREEAEGSKAEKKAAREEEEYESGGGGSSDSEPIISEGCSSVLGKIVIGVCALLGLMMVLIVIFGKNEDANDPAVKMAKWEEHLEKRRAAFAEGLSEEGVEARGLKNFTWEEWQNREQNQNKKPVEKEVKQETKSLRDVFHEYHDIRRGLIGKGFSQAQIDTIGFVDADFDEFKTRYKDKDAEAELKKLKDRIAELDAARDNSAKLPKVEEQQPAVQPDVVKPKVEKPKPVANPNVDKAKLAEQRRAMQQKVGGKNPVASGSGNSAVNGGTNSASNKASKDSTGIAITVNGKGKTKDAAVRWAVRDAVWKTVGTWVDSKERIQANRDKVVALVKTITPSDVRKYEILESHEEDGNLVLKVKVHVSKKMIAPKFAGVFPDVFGNDNN